MSRRNDEESSSGCLIPILIALALVGGTAYLVYRTGGYEKILAKFRPPQRQEMKIIDPSKLHKQEESAEKPKPAETNVVEKPVELAPPPPPKKTIAQMCAETERAQKALDQEIAKARAANTKSLPGFAGVRFGNELEGSPIALETLPASGSSADDGLCYRMFGPKLAKPFERFGQQPTAYVTPMTRKAFRIEFSRNIERKTGWKINPDTTNLVQDLSTKLKCKPYGLDCDEFPLANHEFVFPMGETTLTVGEYGGAKLKLIVEHAGFRALAVQETAAIKKESLEEATRAKSLTSDKYPNGGMVKFGRVRMKKGTPKAFCGIVFGSLPPYSATSVAPASSAAAHGFYVDYRKSKCPPFMNFEYGKVELSRINDAVISVNLFSNGPENGLSDVEYFNKVRTALEQKFKTKPTSAKGDGPGEVGGFGKGQRGGNGRRGKGRGDRGHLLCAR